MSEGFPAASEKITAYFSKIQRTVEAEYGIAKQARQKRLDPTERVEIALASDAAARVEGLLATIYPPLEGSGLAGRIRELEKRFGKGSERISLQIARDVFEEKFIKFKTVEERLEAGVRVGTGHLTLGIVTAPLEGITKIVSKPTRGGGKYISIYFSGPIRSAGGTAAAFAVLIADFLRRLAGFDPYDPDESELERYAAEIDDYDTRVVNLQYRIKSDEVRFLVKNIPVEISGDPTEEDEVIAFKDLPRIETNRIRGGMCLVVSSIGQKSAKLIKRLKKYGSEFQLLDWLFLEEYELLKKQIHSTDAEKATSPEQTGIETAPAKLPPNFAYMEDVPGGRPIFSFPSTPGGFRLRYGRARNTGFSTVGFHPASMAVLSDFIAIGTQLKIERPGKGATAAVVDSIEPPTVLLSTGEVRRIEKAEEARLLLKQKKISEILFVGDILISYGDFVSNGHKLVPAGYVEEVWLLELRKAMGLAGMVPETAAEFVNIPTLRFLELLETPREVSFPEALSIGTKMKIPLHPKFTYFYHRVSTANLKELCAALQGTRTAALDLVQTPSLKRTLELMCFPHAVDPNGRIVAEADPAAALRISFAIDSDPGAFESIPAANNPLEFVNKLSKIEIRDLGGTYIGARMGRPEKAERRLLDGRPQILFPVGQAGGRLRSVNEAAKTIYNAPLAYRICQTCGKRNIFLTCSCGGETVQKQVCVICQKITEEPVHCNIPTGFAASADVNLDRHLKAAEKSLNEKIPPLIKGVRGLSSRLKIPEKIEKGVLRAKNNLFVNKDGTIRFDATNLPLTHFKPKEIGVSMEKLLHLGYDTDIHGLPLSNSGQILELKPQDIILSDFEDSKRGIMSGAEYFVRIANYVDNLLVKFYGLPSYYNIVSREDLAGHLVIGLAPHTSAGIVGRIIGFSKARAGFAHPMFHAAKRRDCDGDEDSVMLLIEALIDFSREFLPNTRGSSTMDVPLVLTTILDPTEVDDQVHELDIASEYPLELYEKAQEYVSPVLLERPIERLKNRLGKPAQYEGMSFTHATSNISDAVSITRYRFLGAMVEKVTEQLELAERVTAVNADDVANLVLSTHFIRDIKGNMRTFCRQSFRCVKCNEKYRRVPLVGRCLKCRGKLVLTVYQGTIEKYLEASKRISEKYNVPPYLKQELLILQKRLSAMFGKENQKNLDSFFAA
ncbi:MAG: DNA polymerase II large subunit [archaeon]